MIVNAKRVRQGPSKPLMVMNRARPVMCVMSAQSMKFGLVIAPMTGSVLPVMPVRLASTKYCLAMGRIIASAVLVGHVGLVCTKSESATPHMIVSVRPVAMKRTRSSVGHKRAPVASPVRQDNTKLNLAFPPPTVSAPLAPTTPRRWHRASTCPTVSVRQGMV